mmetsp:Transcript_73611/g.170729  ORF Transcript_73611/g.170729 Transcript_73611/m.170729 type:complete len:358 (-) Transcript_73611:659-1732(-)
MMVHGRTLHHGSLLHLLLAIVHQRFQEEVWPVPKHSDVEILRHGLRVALAHVLHHPPCLFEPCRGHRVQLLTELEERGMDRQVSDEVEEALVNLLPGMPNNVVLHTVAEGCPVSGKSAQRDAAVEVLEVLQHPSGQFLIPRLHSVVRRHVPVVDIDCCLGCPLDSSFHILVVRNRCCIEQHPALGEEEGHLQPDLTTLQGVQSQELIEAQVAITMREEVRRSTAEELVEDVQARAEIKVLKAELIRQLQHACLPTLGLVFPAPLHALRLLVQPQPSASPDEVLNRPFIRWQVLVAQPLVVRAVGASSGHEHGHTVQQRMGTHCLGILCDAPVVPDIVVVPKHDPDRPLPPREWMCSQ